MGHLTGANNQWNTTFFAVNPDWLVDGTNRVEIFVDTLGNGCWATVVRWIQINVVTTPPESG